MRPASAADADYRGRGLGDALRLSFPEYRCKGRDVSVESGKKNSRRESRENSPACSIAAESTANKMRYPPISKMVRSASATEAESTSVRVWQEGTETE